MSNYLYNGVELPDISPFLKGGQTYPYVIIYKSSSYYKLLQSSSKPYKESNRIFVVFPNASGYEYLLETNEDGWEHQYDHNGFNLNIAGDKIIWTNKDILNEDGSVYLAASDPVPVPDEPEEPETPDEPEAAPHDFYIIKNGVGQKQDTYKRIGGQCVKQDEYLS